MSIKGPRCPFRSVALFSMSKMKFTALNRIVNLKMALKRELRMFLSLYICLMLGSVMTVAPVSVHNQSMLHFNLYLKLAPMPSVMLYINSFCKQMWRCYAGCAVVGNKYTCRRCLQCTDNYDFKTKTCCMLTTGTKRNLCITISFCVHLTQGTLCGPRGCFSLRQQHRRKMR